MGPVAPSTPRSVWWESFALTDWEWTLPAFAAALVVLIGLATLPWLFRSYAVVAGFAVIAAAATAWLRKVPRGALPGVTLLRYMLVDATFIAFGVHLLAQFLLLALAFAGLRPIYMAPHAFVSLVFVFVCLFYATLSIAGYVRSSATGRGAYAAVVIAIVVLVALGGYRDYTQHSGTQSARNAIVTAYETATGKKVEDIDRLSVGNSLHGFDDSVTAVALDQQGRYIVSGRFRYYVGKDARGLVRVLADGTLDPAFAVVPFGNLDDNQQTRILVAPDGSIIINRPLAGSPGAASGLTRLRPDGTVDTDFRPDIALGANERFDDIWMLADGSLIAVSRQRFVKPEQETCLYRLDPSGARVRAFETAAMRAINGEPKSGGQGFSCSIQELYPLASGHVLVQGSFPAFGYRPAVVRLNADGTHDSSYTGFGADSLAFGVATPTGEYFAVHHNPVPEAKPPANRSATSKFGPDGRPDASFKAAPDRFHHIHRIAAQPDGKLLVAGSLGGRDYAVIARLLPNGDPDPSFGDAAGVVRVDGIHTDLFVQPDGRILIAGQFRGVTLSTGQRVDRFGIARLLPDGSLDPSFVPR